MRRWFPALAVSLALTVPALAPAQAQDDRSPDAALDRLLAEARQAAPDTCNDSTADRLVRVLCAGRIRVGVREYYPLFATIEGNTRRGFEIDVVHALARRLEVEVDFVRVNAATRIPFLGEDRIDLAIATMGHNSQRDGQVRFIRPHYYQSETTLVGPRSLKVAGWKDVAGRAVCVTIGNGSNAEIVSQNTRLMLFDEAGVLPDRLRNKTCTLAAQDDSFFAAAFTDPAFAERFEQKFGFAQVPWGMAVAKTGSERLGRALDLISQIFHRDGVFLGAARANRIGLGFLEKQQAVWRAPPCNVASASTDRACVLPPLTARSQPTSFAREATAFEAWVLATTGISLALPMLKTAPAWAMFLNGIANSLILIAGALLATLAFAVLLGAALGARSPLLRWPARMLTVTLQSSPIVLTLVIAAAVAQAFFAYSDAVALGASILALGLVNGSNAGQAVSEAMHSLRAERGEGPGLFVAALGRAATQIVAFLINAAKGTPIASFIGAPELLGALTDITSFSSGRATTFTMVLVFYIVIVMLVVWLCERLKRVLERREVAA
jgi:polar amino acid transport system substrate-binding protein